MNKKIIMLSIVNLCDFNIIGSLYARYMKKITVNKYKFDRQESQHYRP